MGLWDYPLQEETIKKWPLKKIRAYLLFFFYNCFQGMRKVHVNSVVKLPPWCNSDLPASMAALNH